MQNRSCLLFTTIFGLVAACFGTVPVTAAESARVTQGLQALYDFSDVSGNLVPDVSGVQPPLNLRIADPQHVRFDDGSLQIKEPTTIATQQPPARLINAVRESDELTLEVWCQPQNLQQKGPARLLTLSKNASERNVTLGQDGKRFDVRCRTTRTSGNGIPSVASADGSVTTELTHVVYTRRKGGLSRLYINGRQVKQQKIEGTTTRWSRGHRLALGDELSGGRPWLGTLKLVAIYDRALTTAEVDTNFVAGATGTPSPELLAQRQQQKAARHFETVVAPIIAEHCLECHDSATHENGLNLSRKLSLFDQGEDGRMIVPGNAADSLIWQSVESDSMPLERPPLSAQEKAALRQWIDDGAVWTLDEIDPAVYVHHDTKQLFVQRLTLDQYIDTVRFSLGVDIEAEARELLPGDLRADGFSNTAYNLNVDLKHVDAWGRLAETIVSRLDTMKFVNRFSKRRRFTDKDMGQVISRMGKWLLRGPLHEHEVIAYRGITTAVASAGGSFEEAMQLVITAMLQSPRFVYRIEQQRGNGSSAPIDQYELASRLSYILWGGPPDKTLMKAADEGELHGEGLQQQVARMLQHPRAIRQSLRFIDDWLNLKRLDNLTPNAERFPGWNAQLAQDMKAETRAFFEDVVWTRNLPLSSLLNAQVTWTTPELAAFYNLPQPTATSTAGPLTSYDLTTIPARGGLLTQGSLLTVGGDDASTVTRGLLVMHELLRGVVNDPPPCVDTTPVPTEPGVTQRSIAMQRINNAACGGCHSKFEPLAFGLSKFDGTGAAHDQDEHGNVLRDDGAVLFPGSAEPVPFETSAELMDLLADSDRVRHSLTWKIVQFALGRPPGARDAATIDSIHRTAQNAGGTWSAVMTALVTSDLVLTTRTEAEPD